MSDTWEVGIVPDYSTGIDKKTWWKLFKERRNPVGVLTEDQKEDDAHTWEEHDYDQDWFNHGDALSDGNIKWFRK